MPNPVVHFEVLGKDSAKTARFYTDLFGWKVDDTNNPMNYGMVDTGDGEGIAGGIGQDDQKRLTFYVAVPDPQATLDKVTSMGGKVVMPVTEIPGAVTMALFTDIDDNVVGIIKAE